MNLLEIAKDFSELVRARKWLTAFVVVLLSPLFIALLAFSLRWDASYSVSARTQYLEFAKVEPAQPKWAVVGAAIDSPSHQEDSFTGRVALPAFSRILVERIEAESTLLTILPPQTQQTGESVLSLENETTGAVTKVQLPAFMSIPGCAQAVAQSVLPITGTLVLGREVGDQTTLGNPVLTSASVRVLGRELFSPNRFEAARWELDPGDRLAFEHDETGDQLGAGFIQLGCEPGINVVYHAPAKSANVSRFGSVGYTIRPSIWSRLVSDTFFQLAFIMYSSIAPLLFMGTLAVYRIRKKTIYRIRKKKTA